jgi:hypothetical protein
MPRAAGAGQSEVEQSENVAANTSPEASPSSLVIASYHRAAARMLAAARRKFDVSPMPAGNRPARSARSRRR